MKTTKKKWRGWPKHKTGKVVFSVNLDAENVEWLVAQAKADDRPTSNYLNKMLRELREKSEEGKV